MVWAKQAEKFQVYNAILQSTFIKKPTLLAQLVSKENCTKIIQKIINRLIIL